MKFEEMVPIIKEVCRSVSSLTNHEYDDLFAESCLFYMQNQDMEDKFVKSLRKHLASYVKEWQQESVPMSEVAYAMPEYPISYEDICGELQQFLNKREYKVYMDYIVQEKTFAQIGAECNISAQCAQKWFKKARRKVCYNFERQIKEQYRVTNNDEQRPYYYVV